jgi:hypothetical protein
VFRNSRWRCAAVAARKLRHGKFSYFVSGEQARGAAERAAAAGQKIFFFFAQQRRDALDWRYGNRSRMA